MLDRSGTFSPLIYPYPNFLTICVSNVPFYYSNFLICLRFCHSFLVYHLCRKSIPVQVSSHLGVLWCLLVWDWPMRDRGSSSEGCLAARRGTHSVEICILRDCRARTVGSAFPFVLFGSRRVLVVPLFLVWPCGSLFVDTLTRYVSAYFLFNVSVAYFRHFS